MNLQFNNLLTSIYDMHVALVLWNQQLTFDGIASQNVQQILSAAMYENMFRRVYDKFVPQLLNTVGMWVYCLCS